jgi:uncharacterized damage-inducible protein DinB
MKIFSSPQRGKLLNAAYFHELYAYNYWTHRQLWACIEELSEVQFQQDLDYSVGSLCEQCVHTLGIEFWWFRFLKTGRLEFPEPEKLVTRAAVRAEWDRVEQEVMAYITALTPEELARTVKPPFWEENQAPVQVWQALLQIANHSTDHRAQTLAGIHRLGGRTIEQDYLDYHFANVHG